ncbi:hypothetical protein F5Y04DRAFT_271432 [Hypomontagnella monticulosa]|nr:hypothetical protein F5Y04DRAFT_271432 [Hypomontagnella monticulosa]
MVAQLFLGLFGALGHHLYYQRLDGQQAIDPQWPTRFGTALSFFVKAVLISSVEIAYKQQAWVVVKRQSLKVSTLDALFAATHNPFGFMRPEFLLKAPVSVAIAALVWALPLCAIASPSTLILRDDSRSREANCNNVPILNMSRENGYGFDSDDNGRAGMSYWITYGSDENPDGGKWVYTSPSQELERLFRLSILSVSGPLKPPNPCHPGTTCRYSMEFDAPAYRCESRKEFGGHNPLGYRQQQLAPAGRLFYASYSSFDEAPGGAPLSWVNMTSSTPENGVFKELPSLWVGWVTSSSNGYQPHIVECLMYNTTYTYEVTFSGDQMSTNRTSTRSHGLLLPNGSSKAPSDYDYPQFSGYHAAGYLFREFLVGNITQDIDEIFIDNTDVLQSDLIKQTVPLPIEDDLGAVLEERFHNIFLSMPSDRLLHSQTNISKTCIVTESILVWEYKPFWLALPYILAGSFTAIATAFGTYCFYHNGYSMDTNFSTFVTTTRSPDLDDLSHGHCIGKWPMDKAVSRTRLRFGELVAGPNTNQLLHPHASFAFPDNVKAIEAGKTYF